MTIYKPTLGFLIKLAGLKPLLKKQKWPDGYVFLFNRCFTVWMIKLNFTGFKLATLHHVFFCLHSCVRCDMDPECAQLFVQRPPFHPGLRKPTCPSHHNVPLHAQPDENIQTRSQVLDDQVWPLQLKCIKFSLINPKGYVPKWTWMFSCISLTRFWKK